MLPARKLYLAKRYVYNDVVGNSNDFVLNGVAFFCDQDSIEQVTYACVLTKQSEDLQNPITGGWRVIDMAKHDSRPTW